MGITKEQAREGAKEFQEEKGEGTDSSKQFSAAEHQARNDYQDEGSPFGELGNRDRASKEDVPDAVDESDDSSDSDESSDSSESDGSDSGDGDGGDGGGDGGARFIEKLADYGTLFLAERFHPIGPGGNAAGTTEIADARGVEHLFVSRGSAFSQRGVTQLFQLVRHGWRR